MQPYYYLSTFYDILQEEIDYRSWYRVLRQKIDELGYTAEHILEVGAGTGNMTALFIEDKFKVTALEPCEAMLSALVDKLYERRRQLKYFCGELKDFQTAQKYDAIVGFLDVLNYIEDSALDNFFNCLAARLKVGGFAYFDWSTEYKLKEIIGDHTFAESLADFAYIWENQYDATRRLLDFDITVFLEESAGLYSKQVERHRQFAHRVENLRAALPKELKLIGVWGDDFAPVQPNDQRNHIIIERI
ncbi:MAG: hypothetical protein CSA13_00665 [Clostridiales bacterium]|nr:MAG: hypothetical protein CSA13_00665 [Clostridiales bacterium]